MEKRKVDLIKNTAILSFGTLCTKGIMFFMTPLFIRWLTKDDYGTYDLFAEYAALLVPVISLSTSEALFRFLIGDEFKNEHNRVISTIFFFNCSITILIAALSWFVLSHFGFNSTVRIAYTIYLVMVLLDKFMIMIMRGKRLLQHYTISNIISILSVSICVTFFVYYGKLGLAGMLFGYSTANAIACLYMAVCSGLRHNISIRKFDRVLLLKAIKYSLPMIPNTLAWWIVNVSDRTVVSLVLGTGFNAVYAISNKIPSLCQTFFSMFHLSWQQSAIETLDDEDKVKYYNSVLNNMVQIVCSICLIMLGMNFWMFKLLYTVEYFEGFFQTPILVISLIFSMISQYYGSIYVAQMETVYTGVTTVIAAVINIVTDIALIHFIGLYAASISTLVCYVSLFTIRHIDIKRKMSGLKYSRKTLFIVGITIGVALLEYVPSSLCKVLVSVFSVILVFALNYKSVKSIILRVYTRIREKNT